MHAVFTVTQDIFTDRPKFLQSSVQK
jgi:hypothetical protein